jgi:hypothetical protein
MAGGGSVCCAARRTTLNPTPAGQPEPTAPPPVAAHSRRTVREAGPALGWIGPDLGAVAAPSPRAAGYNAGALESAVDRQQRHARAV